jgi:hypothetical protein
MKIITEEHLFDKLSQESSWRKKELANLRALLETKRSIFEKEKVLSRCGIAILYAHWEGFIKQAASAYLEFVSMQRLKHKELADNFISLILNKKIGSFNRSSDLVLFSRIVSFFDRELENQSYLPHKAIINTYSNLSSSILKDIITLLGLDYSVYETKKYIIDIKLLERRNQIAHGDRLIVDIDEYLNLHSEIIGMMELFKNQIENAVVTKGFLRKISFGSRI